LPDTCKLHAALLGALKTHRAQQCSLCSTYRGQHKRRTLWHVIKLCRSGAGSVAGQ